MELVTKYNKSKYNKEYYSTAWIVIGVQNFNKLIDYLLAHTNQYYSKILIRCNLKTLILIKEKYLEDIINVIMFEIDESADTEELIGFYRVTEVIRKL